MYMDWLSKTSDYVIANSMSADCGEALGPTDSPVDCLGIFVKQKSGLDAAHACFLVQMYSCSSPTACRLTYLHISG